MVRGSAADSLKTKRRGGGNGSLPNVWRGPMGAAALALLATGYWGAVAWFASIRPPMPVFPAVEPLDELDPDLSLHVDRVDLFPRDELWPAVPGFLAPPRPSTWRNLLGESPYPRPRPLGLGWSTPPLLLNVD